MAKILYLEDDKIYANELINAFEGSDYEFKHIDSVDKLESIVEIYKFDLILSDLYFDDISHLELLDKLDKFNIPIIVISNSTDTKDELDVFSRNIQEYISKHSVIEVIKLRIDKVIKKNSDKLITYVSNNKMYKLVEKSNVVAGQEGEVIFLTSREFTMLKYMLLNRGQVIDRKQLYYCTFYKEVYETGERVVDVYITNLRKKLKVKNIISIRGVGYKWQD